MCGVGGWGGGSGLKHLECIGKCAYNFKSGPAPPPLPPPPPRRTYQHPNWSAFTALPAHLAQLAIAANDLLDVLRHLTNMPRDTVCRDVFGVHDIWGSESMGGAAGADGDSATCAEGGALPFPSTPTRATLKELKAMPLYKLVDPLRLGFRVLYD